MPMNNEPKSAKRIWRAVVPAFLLAVSVGQIYAFTNFSSQIAEGIGRSQGQVQFAFSLGIFFLGMGAAFFGKIVERNIRAATVIGSLLFISGLCVTALGISRKSLALVYLGYGVMVGLGTGIIYISPVKTMMLWFPDSKAIAAALPIISFGLGSTLSTILHKGFSIGSPDGFLNMKMAGFETFGIKGAFIAFAIFYAFPMAIGSMLLKKPRSEQMSFAKDMPAMHFSYGALFRDRFFQRSWLFMFLNISCGLCLIPLAKQMMDSPAVAYGAGLATAIVALCGIFNGGGRFIFALWSDRMPRRISILSRILAISAAVMAASLWPPFIGIALLAINACYGAGFSVMPAILSDHFGMADISKIHGAVLSAWGVAGLAGNQAALLVSDTLGLGYHGVIAMLAALYLANLANVAALAHLEEGRLKG